mmetsp:Transcript_1937/g.3611  ORF Transcript_1937/g.3611 Transcript_1937/m.3611 type:complete len:263 (-) Transcript_1937:298-1086(-)
MLWTLLLLLLLPLLMRWMLLLLLLLRIGLVLLMLMLMLLLPLLLRVSARGWGGPLVLFSQSLFTTNAFLGSLLFREVASLLLCLLLLLPGRLLLGISPLSRLGFCLASRLLLGSSSAASFLRYRPSPCFFLGCPATLFLFYCSSAGLFLTPCLMFNCHAARLFHFLLMTLHCCFGFLTSLCCFGFLTSHGCFGFLTSPHFLLLLLSSIFLLSGSQLVIGRCMHGRNWTSKVRSAALYLSGRSLQLSSLHSYRIDSGTVADGT